MVVAGQAVPGDNHDTFDSPLDTGPLNTETEQVSDQIPDDHVLFDAVEDDQVDSVIEASSDRSDTRLLSLFARIQALERDYASLQGRVEELEHLYNEEREMNRRRFLDMDRRLREQFGDQLAPEDTLANADLSTETGLYRQGMLLLDSEDYVQAIQMFEEIINTHPNGEKVADAMYWLGEINLNVEPKNLERSRQFYVQLLTMYSEHARVPETIMKLGMVYHELGNELRALEYLDRVIAEYPDHDAARLAASYAEELR